MGLPRVVESERAHQILYPMDANRSPSGENPAIFWSGGSPHWRQAVAKPIEHRIVQLETTQRERAIKRQRAVLTPQELRSFHEGYAQRLLEDHTAFLALSPAEQLLELPHTLTERIESWDRETAVPPDPNRVIRDPRQWSGLSAAPSRSTL